MFENILRDASRVVINGPMGCFENSNYANGTRLIYNFIIDNNENNKSMVVKITDEELIEKTGGIVQGMSGSPIIQDNKIIGAVTNVVVDNVTKGYLDSGIKDHE